ncbi:MAG: hypothetical protein Q7U56_03945, partial [Humidesulfovibrio sp.]|nr:hypothetical protein [Humidesulfovibrio sp.]
MSEDRPEPKTSFFQRPWLRRSLLTLAAVLLLLAAITLAIPPLVSSNWARAKVEHTLAAATGKPASLRLLSLGWRGGLRMEGLLIGRGGLEDETFLCSLERLHVQFGLLSALRKDLRLRAQVSGLRLRHRLEPGPKEPEPPAKPLPALLKDALATLREGLKPGPRTGDLHVLVNLADIAVRLDLAATGSTLDLRDAFFRLDAPGLDQGPIRLNAGLTALHNGTQLAPVQLEAVLEGMVDKTGLLTPAEARLTAKAEAPGLHLAALGSVAKGFQADLRLDLRQAAALLKPLAGTTLPEASGVLSLGLTLAQPDPDHLALTFKALAEGLRASGGPLGGKSVGPLKLNLLQEAAFDLAAGTVRLPGSLTLLAKSAVRWQGEVSGLNEARPTIVLAVRPLHLQLDELLGSARAFLPPGLGIGAASLDAEGIYLKAVLAEKAGQKPQIEARATGLAVAASSITRSSGPERLSLAKARLRLGSARAVLPGSAPGQMAASATLDLEGLRRQGKSPLTVKRAAFPRINARIDGFAQDPAALFGVIGAASLDIAGAVQGLDVPGTFQAPELTQILALRANLPAAKTATASLDSLGLDIPQLRLLQPGKRPVEAPLTLRLTATDIRLGGPAPHLTNVSDAKLALDVGQTLHCAATASLIGDAVRSSGSLTLDAQKLLVLAAPLLPRQAKGSGGVALDWTLSAALPPQQSPAPKLEKLSQTLKRLGFLKELEAVLRLTDLSLDWPLAEAKAGVKDGPKAQPGETLRLRGLSTPKPLRLASSGGLRESSLSGSLAFGPLSELPGVGPLDKPLRGLLTLSATQQDLRS